MESSERALASYNINSSVPNSILEEDIIYVAVLSPQHCIIEITGMGCHLSQKSCESLIQMLAH